MNSNIFKGLITALITPFKDNKLDFIAWEKIINYQIDNEVDGIVVGGTTGEGTSLTLEEYKTLLQVTVEVAKGRIAIIAGCSATNTQAALEILKIGTEASVDGFMCSIPAYIKPTQQGIYLHFTALHEASHLPIMLYSVPTRTIVDFADETIVRLADLPRIIALKDAGTDLERPLRMKELINKEFNLLCGNDGLALPYNAQGGVGCVSVASNIVPALCKKLQVNWLNNNQQAAREINQQLTPLYKALFAETNPIPVKYAAHNLGLCGEELRLPLTTATAYTQETITKAMQGLGKEFY
ncbi:4-hydroxy-tetrahydrodipicolinate synthase [Candidatus Tisiphia endosymbiont of Nemotelus uliginosus]|uniref:4-hydroxy-tetrahydrodipicolinate synthase n=1 Tax=Candidatus Tisiphia endosymbiont of Nemotelus uliginosus TaxID=3077926 RepID=UPI0035C893C9